MRNALRAVLPSIVAVALAMAVCFVAVALARNSLDIAWKAYAAMLRGGLGDVSRFLASGDAAALLRPWGEWGVKAALLALTGLAVAVAFTAGLFNIGAQGQMAMGALAAAVAGAAWSLPAGVHPLVCVAVAALAGALWAAVAAVLKTWRGVHEVISTIMLNWIAVGLIDNWLVIGPLAAASTPGHSVAGTDQINATASLPRLLGEASRLHAGVPLAALLGVAVWAWYARSQAGFETRAVGFGPEAAYASGIPVQRRLIEAMLLSGALAGVAGAVLVLGTEQRYPPTLGAPYGFDGIAIALIGQGHPLGVLVAAAWFGALRAGGTWMQLFGVHKSFPELIQGLALLLLAARVAWARLLVPERTP